LSVQYFEDFVVGGTRRFGDYEVGEQEIIEYASRWDPQPFHVDAESAAASVFGGLTASACHTFAICTLLSISHPVPIQMVAALGMEEMRFPNPVRPGDRLSIESEWVALRESRSRPDVGIVTSRGTLSNQDGVPVMTMKSSFMVQKRQRAEAELS
jgi:acyl dehydratase